MMKSKIKNKHEVDWNTPIKISDINMTPELIESHRQKINTVFANKDASFREQQLNIVILHDVIYSAGMEKLSKYYDIEIDSDELHEHVAMLQKANPNIDDEVGRMVGEKTIIRELIFEDLQNEYNIMVSDEELNNIFMNYYQDTNLSIRNFMTNEKEKNIARMSILREKTIMFINQKFKFDLSELAQKVSNYVNSLNSKK